MIPRAARHHLPRNPLNGKPVNGAIIWEGPSRFDGSPIVVIATGIRGRSQNRKTGDMVQVWILRQDCSPVEAVQTGRDATVCGTCPLRGDGRTGKGRACYVNLGQAPSSVWAGYRRGSYPRVTWSHAMRLVAGRVVRLGAYGDPAMMPLTMARTLVAAASGRTGYTHAWRDIDPAWSRLLMASADSVADRRAARAAGYRSFYVMPKGSAIPRGTMECASTRTDRPSLSCSECLACSGTRVAGRGVDVAIIAHGAGAKYVTA